MQTDTQNTAPAAPAPVVFTDAAATYLALARRV